jgi:chromosome segregation ATPase
MKQISQPRRPKGEDPYVTIVNQEHQIKLLIDRVQHLTEELAESNKQREALEQSWSSLSDEYTRISDQLGKVQAANTRLQGFQDCAREVIQTLSGK